MKKTFIYSLFIIIGFNTSCTDDWYEVRPKGEADIETFSNKRGVNALLIGAYAAVDGTIGRSEVESYGSSVSNWLWGSVASDDAYKGASASSQFPMNAIEQHTLDPFNTYLANHWKNLYDGVSRTNDVLRVVPQAKDLTETESLQIQAQARFLRAHFYFELTIVHGKVPYIDENTENPSIIPNDRFLWSEMESDLQFAVDHLPESWGDKGRATQWAAKTYLARVYMFQKKFEEARVLLEDVYTNGGFNLMASYEQNYLIEHNNNAESIFEIQYVANDGFTGSPNAGWGDAGSFPPASAGLGTCCGYFRPSHSLVSAFRVNAEGLPFLDDNYTLDDIIPYSSNGSSVPYTDPVDPRLDHTVGRPGVPYLDWGIHQGDVWAGDVQNGGPYLYKKNMFKQSERALANATSWAGGLNPNNFRKFRLGHVILWLAECEAEVGSLGRATDLVNEIRNRAKNSNVVTYADGTPAANYKVEPYPQAFSSKEEALDAIRHEIRLEFAMEGLRFFDLVRWGMASDILNNYIEVEGNVMVHLRDKEFVSGQHEYAPIPQQEIDISLNNGEQVLTQNPGY